jgi:hypothetical protein
MMAESIARVVDPAVCPLCGQINDCARACGSTDECWCAREVFPRELLVCVPANAQRRACICSACLQKSREPHIT